MLPSQVRDPSLKSRYVLACVSRSLGLSTLTLNIVMYLQVQRQTLHALTVMYLQFWGDTRLLLSVQAFHKRYLQMRAMG